LFEQGLADPRGCEYRSVSVGTGNCWFGDGGVVECHAWVLPAKEKSGQRFAVCWNGMVYPIVSTGDKADWKADIQALLKSVDDARKGQADATFWRFGSGCPNEGTSVSERSMLPLKVCMVLRL
jgi:hypothetical protein